MQLERISSGTTLLDLVPVPCQSLSKWEGLSRCNQWTRLYQSVPLSNKVKITAMATGEKKLIPSVLVTHHRISACIIYCDKCTLKKQNGSFGIPTSWKNINYIIHVFNHYRAQFIVQQYLTDKVKWEITAKVKGYNTCQKGLFQLG